MIKRVPGMQAWVLKDTEFNLLTHVVDLDQWFSKQLPLFDLCTEDLPYVSWEDKGNYYVVINHGIDQGIVELNRINWEYRIKPEYVDIINKTWDQCFDDEYQNKET